MTAGMTLMVMPPRPQIQSCLRRGELEDDFFCAPFAHPGIDSAHVTRPTEQGAASPSRQKKLVFPPAAAPDDLTDAHRKQLAAHIRSELEVDPDAPLSFKTVCSWL